MFSLIVAHSKNNVIGKNNSIPWYIPEDLKRFKEITMGKSMVMGRKTFESLPGILPGRKHIVLTRDINFNIDNKNVEVINDLDSFIQKYQNSDEEIFVIGGGEIYKKLLPYCTKAFITEVLEEIDGDVKFPILNKDEWKLDYKSDILESKNLKYIYKNYTK